MLKINKKIDDIKIKEEFSEGTEIKLFLKESEREEYLDKFRLEHIIKTYANHISFGIFLEHEEGIDPSRVNESQPLWVKSPSDISKEEYIRNEKIL